VDNLSDSAPPCLTYAVWTVLRHQPGLSLFDSAMIYGRAQKFRESVDTWNFLRPVSIILLLRFCYHDIVITMP
jgi:hypothetical protein